MDKQKIENKLREFLSTAAATSKSAFEKAGDKVMEFSDKSVIRLDKKKLESERNTKYKQLGEKVSKFIEEKRLELPEAISFEIESLQQEIQSLTAQIKEKQEALDKE